MMIVVEDMVAEGDKVAARCSVRAKHEGEFMGRAATQAPVEFTGLRLSVSTMERLLKRGITSTS